MYPVIGAGSILRRIVSVPDEVSDYRRWVAAQFPSPEPAGQEPPPAAHRAAAREVRRGVRGYTGRWGVTHGVWGEVYLMCEDF